MVNNSTNINKTNNHLSHYLTEHKKKHMTLDIQFLAWNRHSNVAGLNLLMLSQSSSPHMY
jgi:selenocysteine-specific translation elongation factor